MAADGDDSQWPERDPVRMDLSCTRLAVTHRSNRLMRPHPAGRGAYHTTNPSEEEGSTCS